MTLERWKAKIEGVTDYFDEQGARILRLQAERQETRLKWYLVFAGMLLILFAGISAWQGNYTKMFIFLCTLHLHVILVYRYKQIVGKPQWETPTEKNEVQK